MKLRNIRIIISREYLTRVKKKSFLLTTFLVPVLFAAVCVLPSVIMMLAKEEQKQKKAIPEEIKKTYETEEIGKNSVFDWIKKYADGEENK